MSEILRAARTMYDSDGIDWVTFYRTVLGPDGFVRQMVKPENLAAWLAGEEHAEIQRMIARLRSRQLPSSMDHEPTRVITVRLPKSLHVALVIESHALRVSLNGLCLSKLLQPVDRELVPRRE
jgi:hypothetical protein